MDQEEDRIVAELYADAARLNGLSPVFPCREDRQAAPESSDISPDT
jgi:hypothetical protein